MNLMDAFARLNALALDRGHVEDHEALALLRDDFKTRDTRIVQLENELAEVIEMQDG